MTTSQDTRRHKRSAQHLFADRQRSAAITTVSRHTVALAKSAAGCVLDLPEIGLLPYRQRGEPSQTQTPIGETSDRRWRGGYPGPEPGDSAVC